MLSIEERIDRILSKMSLEEKIGQLNQIPSPTVENEDVFQLLREGKIGSFIMATTAHAGNDDTESVEGKLLNKLQKIAVEESPNGIPVIFGRDVIHGHHTVLPIPLATAASFDPEQVKECYRDVAKEARRDGVHWTFAPMLDLSRDPRWGRCIEGPGEDGFLAGHMAKAVVEGFQGDDLTKPDAMAACAKHYIGYGASEGGRDYHRTEISDYTLRNCYLPAFRSAVDSGVQTVMSSFNTVSGQPVTTSRYLLTDVLRGELGFDGYVISDWEAIRQTRTQGVAKDDEEAAKLSIQAGLDMDMVDNIYTNHLKELVENGSVSTEQIDESVRRVLRVKMRLELFENPYVSQYAIDPAEHRKKARKLAADSMVLLKNDGALPLSKQAAIGLVGPMAEEQSDLLGSWCLDGKPEDVISLKAGIQAVAPQATVTAGYEGDAVILALGESKQVTGEANSVANLEVTPEQVALAKAAHDTGKPVIAVLFYGRPVVLSELEPYCNAMLYAWHPGTEGGLAAADILFGEVNPSAKLPMTLPRKTGQIPIYYNHEPASRQVNGYYGDILDVWCNYHDCDGKPLYPFGHGLSYTDFQIVPEEIPLTHMSLDALESGERFSFPLKITNTGKVKGKEVVQLYIRDQVATMVRPIRELKDYRKIELAPGETATLSLSLGWKEMGFFQRDGKYGVEPGAFDIFMGSDCYAQKVGTVVLTAPTLIG